MDGQQNIKKKDCIQLIMSFLVWLSTLQEFIIMRVIKHSGTRSPVHAAHKLAVKKTAVTLSVRSLNERADDRETWVYMR